MEEIKFDVVYRHSQWLAQFTIGVQTFTVCQRDDKKEAEWYIEQLKLALSNIKPASPPSMPDLETCKDKVLEIIQKNYNEFKGTNEAELHSSHEIANWMCSQCDGLIKQKDEEIKSLMEQNAMLAKQVKNNNSKPFDDSLFDFNKH